MAAEEEGHRSSHHCTRRANEGPQCGQRPLRNDATVWQHNPLFARYRSPPRSSRMGTRTEILKIAGDLRDVAAKNPSVAPRLHGIIADLEACAERADQKRMEKKKAVKGLLTSLQTPAAAPSAGPK